MEENIKPNINTVEFACGIFDHMRLESRVLNYPVVPILSCPVVPILSCPVVPILSCPVTPEVWNCPEVH